MIGFTGDMMPGIYFRQIVEVVKEHSMPENWDVYKNKFGEFSPLKQYPMTIYLPLILEGTKSMFPDRNVEEAVYDTARFVFKKINMTHMVGIMRSLYSTEQNLADPIVSLLNMPFTQKAMGSSRFVIQKIDNRHITITIHTFDKVNLAEYLHGMMDEIYEPAGIKVQFSSQKIPSGYMVDIQWVAK